MYTSSNQAGARDERRLSMALAAEDERRARLAPDDGLCDGVRSPDAACASGGSLSWARGGALPAAGLLKETADAVAADEGDDDEFGDFCSMSGPPLTTHKESVGHAPFKMDMD